MADNFLAFSRKLWGRYGRLARLDQAGRAVIKREVAMGGLVVMVGLSFWPLSPIRRAMMNVGARPNGAKAHLELAKEAARVYDYELAEREFQLASKQVLGVREEVFPEEVVKAEIAQWEKVTETINSRDVWLNLAGLYWQVFNEEKAQAAWQKAWLIDPNNKGVISLQRVILP